MARHPYLGGERAAAVDRQRHPHLARAFKLSTDKPFEQKF
jgi:hypothetical protein